jgi:hypothetical protein
LKTTSLFVVILGSLIGLASVGGIAWMNASTPRKPYPKATPPPPPSAVFHAAKDPAPTQEEIEREELERNDRLASGIESALVSANAVERETAFTHLLPRLLQFEPARVVEIFARQQPGAARDLLRTEVARLWATRDRDAAIAWLKTLDEPERRAGAAAAVDALAASAPDQAIHFADRFDIGRDDGYLEQLVHMWATEDLAAAERWLATQPDGPQTTRLRARVDRLRARNEAAGD